MSTLFDRQLTLCWIYHGKVDPGKHTPIIDRFGTVGTVLIQWSMKIRQWSLPLIARWSPRDIQSTEEWSMIVDQELNFTIYARWLTKDRHFQDKTDVTSTDQAFNTGGSKHGPNKVPSKRQRTNKHPQQRCISKHTSIRTSLRNCQNAIIIVCSYIQVSYHCRLNCWTWKWCRDWYFQQGRRTRRGGIVCD